MPIKKTAYTSQNAIWGFWHIEEGVDELMGLLSLNDHEHAQLAKARHPKKQLEWLAGRALVAALCQQIGITYRGITKDEYGKPRLQDCEFSVSITNAFPYAAAIISPNGPLGIDLDLPRTQLLRVAHRVFEANEMIDAGENLRKLCIYWCAKEALYKLYGKRKLIFRENLKIQPFTMRESGELTGIVHKDMHYAQYKLRYLTEAGHIVVFNL